MLLIIISILVIALVLLVVEMLFIPGTTLVGLLGLFFAIAGIILVYKTYGAEIGFYTLTVTSILTLSILVYSLKSNLWSRFSLQNAIRSKVNEGMTAFIQVNEIGRTVSTLRPIGKARFNDQELEVKTLGRYIAEGVSIRVIQIDSNQIIVEPTN